MLNDWARWLLRPFAPFYRLGLYIRERQILAGGETIDRLAWPVVSIGNLSVGGAGKTPLAIALARALRRRGRHVDVLSRGYGRKTRGALRIDPAGAADDFGDEPLEIARAAGVPVYVAGQRLDAGRLAEREALDLPAGIHLLDDGFQHRQLHRDVDIVLLNRADWHGRLLPIGDLREPVRALRRAHILAIPADDPEFAAELRAHDWPQPFWLLRRRMEVPRVAGPVVAFCGIARPEQFFAGVEAAGLRIASRVAFRDHHRYLRHDLDCLLDAARSVGAATLLTTEKDRVRLGALAAAIPASLALRTARLHIEIQDEAAAIDWLLGRLQKSGLPPAVPRAIAEPRT
ncbi:MAG: tetraacyldisaccharide 4'-kinase [Acidobacteriota bacterium]